MGSDMEGDGLLERLRRKGEKMREKEERITTLIGTKLAKEGEEFIFLGEAKKCEGCRLRNSCINLQPARRYRIEKVRDIKHDCLIHEDGVCMVEVEEAPIKAAIEARRAFEGAKVIFEAPECEEALCELYDYCHPLGLRKGDKCVILRVIGDVFSGCKKGYSLKMVEMRREEE
ncbi:MAG: UPF0179 family protein [Candidatus Methanospirareceae archaeon]